MLQRRIGLNLRIAGMTLPVVGEYISSMSNAAAMCGKENGYVIWGVNNKTHELTNTTFDYRKDIKGETLRAFSCETGYT